MNQRKITIELVEKLICLANEQELGAELTGKLTDTRDALSKFKIKVPLMGGFNAGKSSLLNQFINKGELLPTAIKAETTIAAEIKYGEIEKIVAHKKGAVVKEIDDLSSIKNCSPADFDFIEFYVNSNTLLDNSDIEFVDMPGLDSDIKAHNQAIMTYLNSGSYFIVLADIEQQVRGTVIDFISNEIVPLGYDFAIVLTKSELKDESEQALIRESVSKQIEIQTGHSCPVAIVSAHDGKISEFADILAKIDFNKAVQVRFQQRTLEVVSVVERALAVKRTYAQVDTRELDDKLRQLRKGRESLCKKLEEEDKRISIEFSNSVMNGVLRDIDEALKNRIDSLVSAAMTGGDAFGKVATGILRPTLIASCEKRVGSVLSDSRQNLMEWQQDFLGGTLNIKFEKDAFANIVDGLRDPKARMALSAALIALEIAAPWVELIILFLPDIIKLFSNETEKIKETILNVAIPKIQEKLREEIWENLQKVKTDFLQTVEIEINSQLRTMEETLQNIETERSNKTHEEEQTINSIDSAIDAVKIAKDCFIGAQQ
jgi:GTP-binding protein EngB required for normal cell division